MSEMAQLRADRDRLVKELAEAKATLYWRCFHCDEIFTAEEAAREHFGPHELCSPACHIDIAEYRRMETVHQAHLSETDEASTAFHAMRADHAQALIREEEKGYSKGVADMNAALATAQTDIARLRETLETIDLRSRDPIHVAVDGGTQLVYAIDAIGRIGICARAALNPKEGT